MTMKNTPRHARAIGCALALAGLGLSPAALAESVHRLGQNNIESPAHRATGPSQRTRAQVMQDYAAFKQAGGLDYAQLHYSKPNQMPPGQAADAGHTQQPASPAQPDAALRQLYGN
jgi:hypothetical protein